jgi:hypothetical protein
MFKVGFSLRQGPPELVDCAEALGAGAFASESLFELVFELVGLGGELGERPA